MQRRQEWMRDYLIEEGAESLPFIGTVTLASSPLAAAESIRRTLGMEDGWAELHPTWSNALLGLRRAVEETGVLVVINGVFGNNTHQALDPEEFLDANAFIQADTEKDEFQHVADGWLAAFAKANSHVVVTLEEYDPLIRKKVPLPNVCRAFDVEWITPFEMLRRLNVQLDWESPS
jgi:hypothetical protein